MIVGEERATLAVEGIFSLGSLGLGLKGGRDEQRRARAFWRLMSRSQALCNARCLAHSFFAVSVVVDVRSKRYIRM